MTASYVLYIDESGDEGFSFGKGSPDWFVLSGVITRKSTDLETVKVIDQIRALLGLPDKKPIHFRDLKHDKRVATIDLIAKADLRAISILIHKPSINEPEKFRTRYQLYFQAVRLLFERASWYCRDHQLPDDTGDCSAEIIFSNRSGMSYEEIRQHMTTLKSIPTVQIDWKVIKPEQIEAYTAGRRMGLQIADAVASSFYYALQPSQYGFIEDRYARMLKPVIYHHKGKSMGYGIKFWPGEVKALVSNIERYEWIRGW
jgi:hypothetical protein